MVTISGLYFLMVLLLHSRLQVEICNTATQVFHRHNETTTDKVISRPVKMEIFNWKKPLKHSSQHSCYLPPETNQFSFQTVEEDLFYLYSAYLDTRLNATYIRIMSILLRGKKDHIVITCSVMGNNNKLIKIVAEKYEMCENHNKKYGGWIMSCLIPKSIPNPCNVTISLRRISDSSPESRNITLNLIRLDPGSVQSEYAVCIPPLFGNVNSSRLIEFMEITRYFGAEKFIFYSLGIQDQRSNLALDYYTNKSLASVIPWKLPENIKDAHIWYHGQLIAHNDCLYRSMSLTDKLAIQDIDELIVMHDWSKYWHQTLSQMLTGNVVGLGIYSAFFDTTAKGDVLSFSSIKRTKMLSRFRTKVLVKPTAIFEIGIHHVSKPLLEHYKIMAADVSKVILHHYRGCLSNYGMNCKAWIEDRIMKEKYGAVGKSILHVRAIVDKLNSIQFNLTDDAQVVIVQ